MQPRVCDLAGIDPGVYRYRLTHGVDDIVWSRLLAPATQSRRFNYRRLHILFKRQGFELNWKKLYRLYRLRLGKHGVRKQALGARAPMATLQGPNKCLSVDFVLNALVDGGRFRILCVVDDFSRECLAVVIDNSLSGEHVAREMDKIAEHRELLLHYCQ